MYPDGTPEDKELEQNVDQIENVLKAVGRMTLEALEEAEC